MYKGARVENRVFANRYRITEKIGTGGMAEVFKAQDETLGRTVAVKTMLPQYASDPTFAARFRQEAQAAANLSSPYIVNIYDWGKDNDTYFIVMEYVRGVDLKTAINQRGAINQRKVAEIGSQVCSALAVAHGYDIIHRDIKPHNIMVQPDGNAKVMDFGIARAGNSQLTQTSSVLGTAHYVSPEQAQGKKLGPQSDLYSLGIVLYEASTGKLPFDAPDAVAVALKQVNELPIPPSEINPGIDPVFEAIIMHALEKNPANRFSSANQMKTALNNYLAGRSVMFDASQTAATSILDAAPTTAVPPMSSQTSVMPGGMAGDYRSPYANNAPKYIRADDERKKKKKWPIVAIIVAIVAVLGIAGALYALTTCGSNKVTVPSVVGMPKSQANTTLVAAGFEVTVKEENSETVATGNVISQDPKGKTNADKGSTVTITVSKGPAEAPKATVPNLSNMTAQQAEAAIVAAGFVAKAGTAEYSETIETDKVVKQDPAANSSVAKGSTVTYVLSKGKEALAIPNVTGMSQSNATNTLKNAGFEVSVTDEYSDSVASGNVVWQDPGSSSTAAKGSTVTICVSKGAKPVEQATVPNLIGMTKSQAEAACSGVGLVCSVASGTTGTVGDQNPTSGTKVEKGSTVQIILDGVAS